jgi:hypothetical protein
LAGRTPCEAVANFLAPLKAIIGCITAEGFVTRYSQRGLARETAAFQDGIAILDRRNGQTLKLELVHRYAVVEAERERGPWSVSTTEYIYEVADERDDPIATFHWHPVVAQEGDEIRWPHVHAYGAREALTLHKLHLPTGRVSIEAVVRFLIEDLDIIPRRPDWDRILERHEQAFRQARTWS